MGFYAYGRGTLVRSASKMERRASAAHGERGQGRADTCAATVTDVSSVDSSMTLGSDHDMTKGLMRIVAAGVLALAMAVAPVSAAFAAPSHHHHGGPVRPEVLTAAL